MEKLIVIITLFATVIFTPTVLADAKTTEETRKEVATAEAKIKYDLAFPGILPDHPLYKLKVLRDKLAAALISDPLKKIEYFLLQTDKGLLASAMLVDKKNIKLAHETALKAENNYTLLTQELYKLPRKPNEAFFEKLKTASLKHQEVLDSIIKRVSKEEKKTFEAVVDFSKRNLKTVEEYHKRKQTIQ